MTNGTPVHKFLNHKLDIDLTKPNPVYLYGYGSYGINIEPSFGQHLIELLDLGFIHVIINPRGSSYLGYNYYLQGKMLNKKNSFNDFIECAEYLINNGFTNQKLLTICGRSAGRLLVGACMTMRPELFNTVICGVPFVDVMTTISDSSIPLTVDEYVEWGNPNIQKYFEYMLSYSPYNNIKDGIKYPNLLLTTGYHDPRV
jgi:oligopeptidase B